ncbi:type II toxin-antitoxin system toxin DNA ADP-ribosyl transferase DarT [Bradyrhizobium sp. USDA 10063]
MALPELTAENAFIFRITHKNNLPWILDNGLHCRSSDKQDPNFVNIGLVELIDKRKSWAVPVHPNGTLSDYVPFYFTPRSMMAYNIHTGRNVPQRDNDQIVILVTSLGRLKEKGVPFVITDRHACATLTKYSNQLDHLERIDWKILQNSDFSRDNDDPDKTNRYMAEALVHKHMPIDVLLYVACCDEKQRTWTNDLVSQRKLKLEVNTKRGWYF